MKILFSDIDGILTTTASGDPFKQHPKDVKIIPGADEGLNHLFNWGYLIFGISNQGGVEALKKAPGKSAEENLKYAIAEMRYTLLQLPQIKSIFFCPDFSGTQCWEVRPSKEIHCLQQEKQWIGQYRKPNPGMIYQAIHTLIEPRPKLENCWLIGDRPEDEQCAANAGINFCPASVYHARFTTGLKSIETTPQIIEFLEGVKIS